MILLTAGMLGLPCRPCSGPQQLKFGDYWLVVTILGLFGVSQLHLRHYPIIYYQDFCTFLEWGLSWGTKSLLTATTNLPSLSVGMPVAPPSHGTTASHGPMRRTLGHVWRRHGWLPSLGQQMDEHERIEREWCIGFRWPCSLKNRYNKQPRPRANLCGEGFLREEVRLGWCAWWGFVPSFGAAKKWNGEKINRLNSVWGGGWGTAKCVWYYYDRTPANIPPFIAWHFCHVVIHWTACIVPTLCRHFRSFLATFSLPWFS